MLVKVVVDDVLDDRGGRNTDNHRPKQAAIYPDPHPTSKNRMDDDDDDDEDWVMESSGSMTVSENDDDVVLL